MAGDREAKRGRWAWVLIWSLAVAMSLLALVYGLSILNHFWALSGSGIGGAEFLLLPLVFVPLLIIALTLGGRPSRRATVLLVVLCLVIVLLGLAVFRLIGQTSVGDGNWYRGPGSWSEVSTGAAWHAWRNVALVYAGCGVVMLALSAVALRVTKSNPRAGDPVRTGSA